MARIKIKDLPKDMKVSIQEMQTIRGGYRYAPYIRRLTIEDYSSGFDIFNRRGKISSGKTGEPVKIKATNVVKFKPGKKLRDSV